MEIKSNEDYQILVNKCKKQEIDILIATDYFLRYFWTSGTSQSLLKSIGVSLKYEYIISIISSMQFIIVLISCIGAILYSKWWSVLIIPIFFILWGLLLNIIARKKINLFLGIIIFVIGMLIALYNQEKGIGFQIMVIGISLNYFFMEFTQYIANAITTHLLLTNYNFYQFFQHQKGKFGNPFFV